MTDQAVPISVFTGWLASGERGISSEAIVSHLTGVQVSGWRGASDHPYDPDDFRQCERLLSRVSLARLLFPRMASRSKPWARLVAEWDTIKAQIEDEAPEYLDGVGSAPLASKLMNRVIVGRPACDGCQGSGRAGPCPKCKGTGRLCFYGQDCDDCRGRGYVAGDSTRVPIEVRR